MEPDTSRTQDVDKTITKAVKSWTEYDFKDLDLWDSFQEHFDRYTELDFKVVENDTIRKLRTFLRKRGAWIEKKARLSPAKSLFNTVQEQEPTPWTESEIKECNDSEKFASNRIISLFETD